MGSFPSPCHVQSKEGTEGGGQPRAHLDLGSDPAGGQCLVVWTLAPRLPASMSSLLSLGITLASFFWVMWFLHTGHFQKFDAKFYCDIFKTFVVNVYYFKTLGGFQGILHESKHLLCPFTMSFWKYIPCWDYGLLSVKWIIYCSKFKALFQNVLQCGSSYKFLFCLNSFISKHILILCDNDIRFISNLE